MKAIVLAGVISTILLTASVVVGFFQHAAFVNQKSNHRTGRYVSNQVGLSAGASGADDLSALLETAKSDFTNSASAVGKAAVSPSPVVNDPINEILKETQATLQHNIPLITLEEGKALPLNTYVKASAAGNAPSGPTSASWDVTKSNLELLRDNTVRLFGVDPSQVDYSSFKKIIPSEVDFSSIQKVDFPSFQKVDFSLLKFIDYFNGLPADVKTWGIVAAGTAVIILGVQSKKTKAPKKTDSAVSSSEDIQSTSAVIGGLTDELVSNEY